jgi:GT2 family glycosyltransferase
MQNKGGVIAVFNEHGSDNPKREYTTYYYHQRKNLNVLLKRETINFFPYVKTIRLTIATTNCIFISLHVSVT